MVASVQRGEDQLTYRECCTRCIMSWNPRLRTWQVRSRLGYIGILASLPAGAQSCNRSRRGVWGCDLCSIGRHAIANSSFNPVHIMQILVKTRPLMTSHHNSPLVAPIAPAYAGKTKDPPAPFPTSPANRTHHPKRLYTISQPNPIPS